MFDFNGNVVDFFFKLIREKGKYDVIYKENGAILRPRLEDEYYKPVIIVKSLKDLEYSLYNYIQSLSEFYNKNDNSFLFDFHDLSYFLNNLFFNMTVSDAIHLEKYIDKRAYFLKDDYFAEFDVPQLITTIDGCKFYVQRVLEHPGFESPYYLEFSVIINGETFQLPLVRYAFDENHICHLFSIQYGRKRIYDINNNEFKKYINKINSGIKKYRNISPSFVISFKLFLDILNKQNITQIVVPDYLFCRYRNYYRAQTVVKSDSILKRILDNFIYLMQRMEYQFPYFEIEYFPNEIDSYTHIKLNVDNKEKRIMNKV